MLFSIVCKFFLFLLQGSFSFIDINKNNIWQGHPRSSVTLILFITTSNTRLYKLVSPVLNELREYCSCFLSQFWMLSLLVIKIPLHILNKFMVYYNHLFQCHVMSFSWDIVLLSEYDFPNMVLLPQSFLTNVPIVWHCMGSSFLSGNLKMGQDIVCLSK